MFFEKFTYHINTNSNYALFFSHQDHQVFYYVKLTNSNPISLQEAPETQVRLDNLDAQETMHQTEALDPVDHQVCTCFCYFSTYLKLLLKIDLSLTFLFVSGPPGTFNGHGWFEQNKKNFSKNIKKLGTIDCLFNTIRLKLTYFCLSLKSTTLLASYSLIQKKIWKKYPTFHWFKAY